MEILRKLALGVLLALPAKICIFSNESIHTLDQKYTYFDSTLYDNVFWGVLTCSPGEEMYSLYGHTALRYRNLLREVDVVFNYGIFDFSSDNFLWRFVLGQTDYEVAPVPTHLFLQEYVGEGRGVWEQELNLSATEKQRLEQFLEWNILPENRTYRYNFLTKNCATCVLDAVEGVLDGKLLYPNKVEGRTYRTELHRFTKDSPWTQLGNDLLLGAQCDTVLSPRSVPFLPYLMMEYLDTAQVQNPDGSRRNLVAQKHTLLPENPSLHDKGDSPLHPAMLGWGFTLLCIGLAVWEHRSGKMLWGFDVVVLLMQGLAGLLVTFMLFFSEHPTVGSNWQALFLNPIPLICLPWIVYRAYRHTFCWYHPCNVIYLAIFVIISLFIPQKFAEIILPLSFGIAVRSASYWINTRRNRK